MVRILNRLYRIGTQSSKKIPGDVSVEKLLQNVNHYTQMIVFLPTL